VSHTLLFVDDESNVLESLRRSLFEEPHRILTAKSGQEALKVMAYERVDLVISDHDMPGMLGVDLLTRIHQEYPDTIRLMLTGKATTQVAIDAINKGAISRFLKKPCDSGELAVTIRQLLREKDLLEEARRMLNTVRRQADLIEDLERLVPGMTKVRRDPGGAVILDDVPTDFDAFMRQINEEVSRAERGLLGQCQE
jgi:DNA-binding NtrC family response regulator